MWPFIRPPILPPSPPVPMMPCVCVYSHYSTTLWRGEKGWKWILKSCRAGNGIHRIAILWLTRIHFHENAVDWFSPLFVVIVLPAAGNCFTCSLHTSFISLLWKNAVTIGCPVIMFSFFMRLTLPCGMGRYYSSNRQIINKRVTKYCGIYNGQRENGLKHSTLWLKWS